MVFFSWCAPGPPAPPCADEDAGCPGTDADGTGRRRRIPDNAPIRQKMMYASSKENLKRKLNGIQVEVQATDASEIDQSVMHEKCMALAG